jgi:hypothetical protein
LPCFVRQNVQEQLNECTYGELVVLKLGTSHGFHSNRTVTLSIADVALDREFTPFGRSNFQIGGIVRERSKCAHGASSSKKEGEEDSTRKHDRKVYDSNRGNGFGMVETRTSLNEEIVR